MTQAHESGADGEQIARNYLQQQGWQFITANWFCKLGEVDLIMDDPVRGERVFVEVRVRQQTTYGTGADTVAWHKQQKLIRTAKLYLQQARYRGPARFDVISIEVALSSASENPQYTIDHIPDAFTVPA